MGCGYNRKESRLFIDHLLQRGFIKEYTQLLNKIDTRKNDFISGDAIIECSNHFQLDDILKQLVQIKIYAVTIIYNGSSLISILNELKKNQLKYIEILVDCETNIKLDEDTKLQASNIRALKKIVFWGQKESTSLEIANAVNFICTKSKFNHRFCGNIEPNNFILNNQSLSEARKHNSCLYRKITIDTEGNIKNCPSMQESFGNIRDTTLAEAIEKPGFKKYWDINKDKIHVCRDCEFRYICTDCRAYVEDPEDILSKPLKCGYNPYTGEWSEWSTNPLKQKAIDFYGMREILTDKTL